MPKISGDELWAAIDPRLNPGGLTKFMFMSAYGGLASVCQLIYLYRNEDDVQSCVHRFFEGAFLYTLSQMAIQFGYYVATKTKLDSSIVASSSAAICSSIFLSHENDFSCKWMDVLVTVGGSAAGAYLLDRLII